MSMRSPTVQDSDLSTRTKIREAALGLFGTEGFTVSVRVIADAAGCSPGLVIHHFGKQGRPPRSRGSIGDGSASRKIRGDSVGARRR
jgi:tetracycline repressor-like protein